jgi:hypothetical protein
MSFVEWLLNERTIAKVEEDEMLILSHENDCRSSLWHQKEPLPDWIKGDLRYFYSKFDGGSLFDSTFIIAALSVPKSINSVGVVFSQSEIGRELAGYDFELPEPSVAFMYQAGIGIYAVGQRSGLIYECDTETGDVETHDNLRPIFEQWWEAVHDEHE